MSLQFAFRVGSSTSNRLNPEVCDTIIRYYCEEVATCPTYSKDWLDIKKGFRKWWNLPHAIGAIDGKHIPIKCPRQNQSNNCNYKGFQTITLSGLTLPPLGQILTARFSSTVALCLHHGFPEAESLMDYWMDCFSIFQLFVKYVP